MEEVTKKRKLTPNNRKALKRLGITVHKMKELIKDQMDGSVTSISDEYATWIINIVSDFLTSLLADSRSLATAVESATFSLRTVQTALRITLPRSFVGVNSLTWLRETPASKVTKSATDIELTTKYFTQTSLRAQMAKIGFRRSDRDAVKFLNKLLQYISVVIVKTSIDAYATVQHDAPISGIGLTRKYIFATINNYVSTGNKKPAAPKSTSKIQRMRTVQPESVAI